MEALLKIALDQRGRRSRSPREQWAPCDSHIHPLREKRLLQTMESCIKKLENSQFYHSFQHLLQASSIFEHLRMVLGSYSKMQMVIYGIGSFESSQDSRLQLSLAILMQKDFRWIGNIEVFDPILSVTECRILEALGFSVLSSNEHGFRRALKPTIFFMPHCHILLYTNLLRANWNPDMLSKVVIFGNSFNMYNKCFDSEMLSSVLAANKFTSEFLIWTNHRRLSSSVAALSWIFFNPTEIELQFMNNLPYKIERKIDSHIYPSREKTLMQTIESCINNLKNSHFYHNFQDKLQTPLFSEKLHMVMGLESKMPMIICGIGSIELNKKSMLQFSLVILMRKDFKWVGDIEVFDLVLSTTECRVLKAFGCSILSLDQYQTSRQALKPTMFFMPHLSTMLYNDFMKANWKSSLLSNIVLFANSFKEHLQEDPYRNVDSIWYISAAQRFTKEFRISAISDHLYKTPQESSYCKDYYDSFHRLTWHFFGCVEDAELQFMNEFMKEYVKGAGLQLMHESMQKGC